MILLLPLLALADPVNPRGEEIVAHAEIWLGKPYAFDSDLPHSLNCLNLVYEPFRATFGERGVRYEVDPIAMIHDRHLGEPVPGLSPVLREDLDAEALAKLQPGDMIYFLIADYQLGCPRCEVATVGEQTFGGWHTALSRGGQAIIHAKPGDVVRHDELANVAFDALWVSRRTR